MFTEKSWYLLKDGNNFGPFSYLEVIEMLQKKSLFESDFIWQPGMTSWKRIAEVDLYSHSSIRDLIMGENTDVRKIVFQRQHVRVSYVCPLIVHNSKDIYKGHSLEISAGGAGILVENPNLDPGNGLFLHFQTGDGVPPFNAVVNIVSKQFGGDQLSSNTYLRYGVQFTSISQIIRDSIRDFAEKKKNAA